ncbi:hypothetical protein PLICRDRAFT_174614 [Plicaturopsis crispa FD-325 SS-3]|nr:hypothetical protein PLICRDRAFT_174614 [Plicaturopsis crispa FD-325 SS-3]
MRFAYKLFTYLSSPLWSWQDPDAWPPPNPTNAHLIFHSVASLLQQWPNTIYPNGHSLVPATIPAGTLLYHARKDPCPPPRTEWLAFDVEYSYEVMATWGSETFLSTYHSTRTLRTLYIDGGSSVLGDTGPLDSQSALIWGNVSRDTQQSNRLERVRAEKLCDLGKDLGFEGVVRMNAGFELLWCDFDEGLELISHINITDPYSNFTRSTSHEGCSNDAYTPDACDLAPDLCNAEWPLPVTGPFASLGKWERQRAATWHYNAPGELRVQPDLTGLISFYDPAVTSLVSQRALPRHRQRLLGISPGDVEYIRIRLREVLMRKRVERWRTGGGSGIEWTHMVHSVLQRYGDRLAELRYVLNSTAMPNCAVDTAVRARSVMYPLVMPYLDLATYPDSGSNKTDWLDLGKFRCRSAFTSGIRRRSDVLTHSEVLILNSIEGVLERICATLVPSFGEVLELNLPAGPSKSYHVASHLPAGCSHDARAEKDALRAIERWRADIGSLMDWLGWTTWIRCERSCAWDVSIHIMLCRESESLLNQLSGREQEVCAIPLWPVSGGGPGGRNEEDVAKPLVPQCVRRVEIDI